MSDKYYGNIVADSLFVSIDVILRSSVDSTAFTTALAADVDIWSWRQGEAAVQHSVVNLSSITASYLSGGWLAVPNMPGRYRYDLPLSITNSGADWFAIQVRPLASAAFFNFDEHYNLSTASQIPDQILKRDMSAVTGEAARSPLNAMRILRNRWVASPTALSVKKEDDTTEAWSASLSTTSGAAPITAIDPA